MFCLTSKWRQKLYTYEKNLKFAFEKNLNHLYNTTDSIPKGLTKLKLCLNHDDQRKTEIDYASSIKK